MQYLSLSPNTIDRSHPGDAPPAVSVQGITVRAHCLRDAIHAHGLLPTPSIDPRLVHAHLL